VVRVRTAERVAASDVSATDAADEPVGAPRLAIATVCLSGTLEDKLAAAAAARFHGVEIFDHDLVASPWSPHRVRQECERRGLAIDIYQPLRDIEAVPPELFRANLRRAERKFDVLEQLGGTTMLVTSSVSPDAVDDDELAAEQLRELADRAAQRGLRIAYEALAWGRFVNTYAHAWRIVRHADHPALGLCLDSFHVLSRGDDVAGIRVIPGAKVFHVQVADAPRLNIDVVEWSRHHRLFPGLGSFDLPGFVGHGVRRPRPDHRLRRPPVARGVQRRLPAGRSPARGHRRDALTPRPAGGGEHPRTGVGP
jgi:sugar phosphate isomerase/epimerase